MSSVLAHEASGVMKRDGGGSVKYHALDFLRGVAAIWVFAFHLGIGFAIVGLSPLVGSVLERGYLGVPMFFVISGYCLMASMRGSARRGEPARTFLYRRCRRIYPPFWCSIAVIIALPYVIELVSSLRTGQFEVPTNNLPESAVDWFCIVTMLQVFRSNGQELHLAFGSINAVYWTLAIEVQFYLIMAIAFASGRRSGLVLLGVTILSCIFAAIPSTYTSGVFLPYWPMFAFGVLLYVVLERGWSPIHLFGDGFVKLIPVLLASIVLGCWAAFVWTDFGKGTPDSASPDLFIFGFLFAVMLWLGHPLDQRVGGILHSQDKRPNLFARLMVLVGAMSYSIYLLHTKLVYFVMLFMRQVSDPGSALFYVGCLVLTVLLCYPFYHLCEKPFIRSRTRAKVREPLSQ